MPQYLVEPNPSVFRACDIRGNVADDEINPNLFYTLGLVLGSLAQEKHSDSIAIGRDGRLSSPELAAALKQGLMETGIQVIDVGLVASPLLYFARQHLKISSSAMVTASHSPKNQNGLKIALDDAVLSDQSIQNLYERILSKSFVRRNIKVARELGITQAYLQAMCQRVQLARPLKVVIDCGNGATGMVAHSLFKMLGCEPIMLHEAIDGNFPNHHPDPIDANNMQDLQQAVTLEQADIGLAFDGDGDRLGVVDSQGELVISERFLMPLAKRCLHDHPGANIVLDVKCSQTLKNFIEQEGGQAIFAATGHARIHHAMRLHKAPMAAEMSAHVFFSQHWYGFDDALFCAAWLLELISQSTKTSAAYFQAFQVNDLSPELFIACDGDGHEELRQLSQYLNNHHPELQQDNTDGVRVVFADGWGLIRASNNAKRLSARFEGQDAKGRARIEAQMRHWLQLAKGTNAPT